MFKGKHGLSTLNSFPLRCGNRKPHFRVNKVGKKPVWTVTACRLYVNIVRSLRNNSSQQSWFPYYKNDTRTFSVGNWPTTRSARLQEIFLRLSYIRSVLFVCPCNYLFDQKQVSMFFAELGSVRHILPSTYMFILELSIIFSFREYVDGSQLWFQAYQQDWFLKHFWPGLFLTLFIIARTKPIRRRTTPTKKIEFIFYHRTSQMPRSIQCRYMGRRICPSLLCNARVQF